MQNVAACQNWSSGDLKKVEKMKDANIPVFTQAIAEGYDIIAPIPSCVLMYKQELPLMFPDDEDIAEVKAHFFDPFEYLMLGHKESLIDTAFKQPLGKVAYHVACHQRVQNFGMKTREFLELIPDTEVTAIERCSGHDGTYAVKAETYAKAKKIARPVVKRVKDSRSRHLRLRLPNGRPLNCRRHGRRRCPAPDQHGSQSIRHLARVRDLPRLLETDT